MNNANIEWKDDRSLTINNTIFTAIVVLADFGKFKSTENHFLLGKPRWMIEKYIETLGQKHIENMVEIGIFQGGSTAFFHSLLNPRRLVAIEMDTAPVDPLENYRKKMNCSDQLKPYYGVDQADKDKMFKILEKEFPQKNIDLVIDDGSHLLYETKSCFNIIFPYLKPGGLYIIEDWSWAHGAKSLGGRFKHQPAMTSLLFEIIMACASSNGSLISEIIINNNSAYIHRGNKSLDQKDFDISKSYNINTMIKVKNPFLSSFRSNIQSVYRRLSKRLK